MRILEVAGTDSIAVLARLFDRALPEVGALSIGRLRSEMLESGREGTTDETLDEVLVVARANGTFELHLHGSGAVVQRVAAHFESDASAAAPQSRREHALELLSCARTEAAARVLLDQAEGALERACTELLGQSADAQDERLDGLLAAARFACDLITPREIVLVGPTNAGKSTLFNALVGSSRVLVSEIDGTTRDAVTEPWEVAGFPVLLSDTAGWREVLGQQPADQIELLGQARGRSLAERADLVVWASREDLEAPELVRRSERWICLRLQSDLQSGGAADGVSALTDPAGAARTLSERITQAFGWPQSVWSPGTGVPLVPEDVAVLEAARAASGSARAEQITRILQAPV